MEGQCLIQWVCFIVLSFVILHLSYVRERERSLNLSKGCIVLSCRTMRNRSPVYTVRACQLRSFGGTIEAVGRHELTTGIQL